jgi:hypothetical protein
MRELWATRAGVREAARSFGFAAQSGPLLRRCEATDFQTARAVTAHSPWIRNKSNRQRTPFIYYFDEKRGALLSSECPRQRCTNDYRTASHSIANEFITIIYVSVIQQCEHRIVALPHLFLCQCPAYARNATGSNPDPRGVGTQCRLRTVLSQSIQARVLSLRSVFPLDNALVFSTKCMTV